MSYILFSEELKYRSFSYLASRFRANPWQIYAALMWFRDFMPLEIQYGLLTAKQARKALRLKIYLTKLQDAHSLAYEKAFNATPEELGAASSQRACWVISMC